MLRPKEIRYREVDFRTVELTGRLAMIGLAVPETELWLGQEMSAPSQFVSRVSVLPLGSSYSIAIRPLERDDDA
jgi:hypothetical protein